MATVRQRDEASRGGLRDERDQIGGQPDPGSPLRVSAASTRSRAFRLSWSARSHWGSAGRRRCSASCMRCCWRRCRMRSRTSSCASISRNRGNPTRDGPCRRRSSGWCASEAASFADVGARYIREDLGLDLSKDGDGQRLRVLMVTSDYFRTLRSEQFHGPGFQIEDEKAGARRDDRSGARRVVLSNTVWRARFNGDPSLIGTTIRLSAEPYEVAGIAPAGLPGSDCGSRRRVAALRPRRRHAVREQLARSVRPAADGRQYGASPRRSSRS